MKVYYHKNFKGFNPVGTAALIVAEDRDRAIRSLNDSLRAQGLPGDAAKEDLVFVPVDEASVTVIRNGDY